MTVTPTHQDNTQSIVEDILQGLEPLDDRTRNLLQRKLNGLEDYIRISESITILELLQIDEERNDYASSIVREHAKLKLMLTNVDLI